MRGLFRAAQKVIGLMIYGCCCCFFYFKQLKAQFSKKNVYVDESIEMFWLDKKNSHDKLVFSSISLNQLLLKLMLEPSSKLSNIKWRVSSFPEVSFIFSLMDNWVFATIITKDKKSVVIN